MCKYTERAQELVGNWMKFQAFGWHPMPEDAEKWCIVYTHNRDSGLLEQSNAKQIAEVMREYEDAIEESHRHWACGWVDGWSIRVYDSEGKITEAFKAYCDLQDRLEEYPVLDEEEYSRMEYEQTWENLESVVGQVWRGSDRDGDLPEGLTQEVWDWLWANEQRELEDRDGQGGYPSEESVERAIVALGHPAPEEVE